MKNDKMSTLTTIIKPKALYMCSLSTIDGLFDNDRKWHFPIFCTSKWGEKLSSEIKISSIIWLMYARLLKE